MARLRRGSGHPSVYSCDVVYHTYGGITVPDTHVCRFTSHLAKLTAFTPAVAAVQALQSQGWHLDWAAVLVKLKSESCTL